LLARPRSRPVRNHQQINLIRPGSYAGNFNGLQTQFQKQSGPLTVVLNYTFSKVLGVRDGETANGGSGNGVNIWPYSLREVELALKFYL